MNTPFNKREEEKIKSWAKDFPYVNGGLFAGSQDVPKFSKIARSYLLHVGSLDWTQINPDIFGSMIQAVADDEERGALGMHYTSVPNILKVLNPLFLDNLRAQLEAANGNPAKLLNLRKRLARIRIFDPACGSGNFLVIAYKEMRAIEAEINKFRGEPHRRTDISKRNFCGIELRHFSCEIARLALVIAEYQCDVLYRGQSLALAEFLPLDSSNWITCGNALRLDWLSICPPKGSAVKIRSEDLLETPKDQSAIDFENEGGETYICGNPPYLGSRNKQDEQKSDLQALFDKRINNWKSLDYVAGWFAKAADYGFITKTDTAFVTTNSICQGLQVPTLWPLIFGSGHEISFAHTSFKWTNLASHNAGVTVAIVGISKQPKQHRRLFSLKDDGSTIERHCAHINAYLAPGESVIVEKTSHSISNLSNMTFGNTPIDGGHLLLSRAERDALQLTPVQSKRFVRRIYGSAEFIRCLERYCLWIEDSNLSEAQNIQPIAQRIREVRNLRLKGGNTAREIADRSHQFQRMYSGKESTLIIPGVSSENREFLPVGLLDSMSVVTNAAFASYDAPLWNMALIASKLHLIWIGTVCGKLKTDFRYSNTLGWNTFPVPTLTEQNKADLTRCAEDILLARESHFPASLADLYEVKDGASKMPVNLREAHERNDETLERIYIGRRFKNDTERLEKLFELYTKKTSKLPAGKKPSTRKAPKTS